MMKAELMGWCGDGRNEMFVWDGWGEFGGCFSFLAVEIGGCEMNGLDGEPTVGSSWPEGFGCEPRVRRCWPGVIKSK
jgi:hypothetical protein